MEEEDFKALRTDASRLRYEPGDVALSRLQAAVRSRIASRETVPGILISWFRPVVAGLMAALVVAIALVTILGTEPADALLAGSDTAFANEDYYSVAR